MEIHTHMQTKSHEAEVKRLIEQNAKLYAGIERTRRRWMQGRLGNFVIHDDRTGERWGGNHYCKGCGRNKVWLDANGYCADCTAPEAA